MKVKFSELKRGSWFEYEGQRYRWYDTGFARNRNRRLARFSPSEVVTLLPECTDWNSNPGERES